jgi:hypothetical protein
MKVSIIAGIIAFFACAWAPARVEAQHSGPLAHKSQDSTQYEITIIDPLFDDWYLKNFNMAEDRTDMYYRSQDLIAVMNWNYYFHTGRYYNVIESYIDYQPNIDYGINVNRKLFWYFKYIKETYGIPLFS